MIDDGAFEVPIIDEVPIMEFASNRPPRVG